MRHPIITASILILVLVTQFGCASSGSDKRFALDLLLPSPGEAVQVAVTSGRFTPEFDIVMGPAKGASGGAVKGGAQGLLGGGILAPFTVPLGLIIGAIVAEPSIEIEEGKAIVREIVAAQEIQNDLRDRVAAIGRARTPYTFTVLVDPGPSSPGEQPDYRSLSQVGIQAVLEVVTKRVAFRGNMIDFDPALRMEMTVNWRLVRTVDNAEISANSIIFVGGESKERTLTELIDRPDLFSNELIHAYDFIAWQIVWKIFPRTESN